MSSKGNKSAKQKLIKLYGPECWIEKLHLRPPEDCPRRYTSKGQLKRMKQLTFHHIRPRSKGGQSTVENGALLSAENHAWFHKQPPEIQEALNNIFQTFKQGYTSDSTAGTIKVPRLTSQDSQPEEFSFDNFMTRAREHYNRAKIKRDTERFIQQELEKEEEDEWER